MRTMSGSPCLHYDCSNRNSFGYCKTTVCINKHYQQEQWGLQSTTNKTESVVIKQQTNADSIRAMTDEELASFLAACDASRFRMRCDTEEVRAETWRWIDWLKQEVKNDG